MLLQPRWRFALSACCLAAFGWVTAGPLPAAELDVHVPPDTEMLVTVNVRQIVDSDLFKKNSLAPAKNALKDLNEVDDVLKDLGFDPFKDLDRVVVASPGGDALDKGLMVVHGKFNLAKFKARGADAARDNGDSLKIHKVGDGVGGQLTIYEVVLPDQDTSLFVALASEKTMLVAPGKDYVVDALKRGKAKKKAVLKSKAFQALVEKMDVKQSASIAVMGKALRGEALDEAPKIVKDLVGKIDALGGGLTLGDDVKFEVVISAKTAADATSFKDSADKGLKLGLATLLLLGNERKELEAVTEIVKTIRTTAKGKLVTIRGRVTDEVIQGALKKDE